MPDHKGSLSSWSTYWTDTLESSLVLGNEGPGAAVQVLRQGEVIYSQGFGRASMANEVPFTPGTPCGIRSVTKVITAAMLLHAESLSISGSDSVSVQGGGLPDIQLGEFAIIRNNIERWTHKYVPAANRLARTREGGSATRRNKPPVHLNATLQEIVTHNAKIDQIGMYKDANGEVMWPVYQSDKAVWKDSFNGSAWADEFGGREVPYDNLFAHKNIMEPLGSVDDIVAQCGAVLYGWDPDDWPQPRTAAVYSDKGGWLTGAVLEELLGNSWYNLARQQFETMGLSDGCQPSAGGQVLFAPERTDNGERYRTYFQGHNSFPVEIKNLAVAYHIGPAEKDGTGKRAYLEPYQSPESNYAIGCAVLSATDLAAWAYKLRTRALDRDDDGYLAPAMIEKMFSTQSGADDLEGTEEHSWPGLNWGFGVERMVPIVGADDQSIETWGSIGQGGYGGYGAAVLWLDSDTVFAITSNSGIKANSIYKMASDYAANFLT
jgi:CubicO group peptidase (beta-lactamase class C family)